MIFILIFSLLSSVQFGNWNMMRYVGVGIRGTFEQIMWSLLVASINLVMNVGTIVIVVKSTTEGYSITSYVYFLPKEWSSSWVWILQATGMKSMYVTLSLVLSAVVRVSHLSKKHNAQTFCCEIGIERTHSIYLANSEEMKQRSRTFCVQWKCFINAWAWNQTKCSKKKFHSWSGCWSFEEDSMLLEEMYFDSRVYGVAHGLLMGFRESVWGMWKNFLMKLLK